MAQKKYILQMTVTANEAKGASYSLLKLRTPEDMPLPQIEPGQFVQVDVTASKQTYLRRPISVNFVDYEHNELWLLVRKAGPATRCLCDYAVGQSVSLVLPLGHGFSIDTTAAGGRVLLVGGGVGVAPLLYLGKILKQQGADVHFLLGARTADDLLLLNQFTQYGHVATSTDDGSAGEKGVVTANSTMNGDYDMIYCCGPMPMMKAVAAIAASRNITCEVSLENRMACGLGACLCCVEKNKSGHNVCVCTEGPVFNISELSW